jgi:hypothetical protein
MRKGDIRKRIEAGLKRRAYGFTREYVVEDEMPKYIGSMDDFVDYLFRYWDRQTVDNAPYAVTAEDWRFVMEAVKRADPNAKRPDYVGSAGWKTKDRFPRRS